MIRNGMLTICFLGMLPGWLAAQEFMIQLSGAAEGVYSDFTSIDGGVPMMLAPVPGYLPTEADRLLSMPRVANDLQLLPDQQQALLSRLKDIREQFRGRQQKLMEGLSSQKDPGEREKLEKQVNTLQKELKDELKSAIDEVLLPFQRQRLDQIVAQSKLNNDSHGALRSEEFAKLLELTDAQQKELEIKQKEMKQKLEEEIRELRKKRQREVIEAVLTKEQLKKLEDLVGTDLPTEEKSDKSGKSK